MDRLLSDYKWDSSTTTSRGIKTRTRWHGNCCCWKIQSNAPSTAADRIAVFGRYTQLNSSDGEWHAYSKHLSHTGKNSCIEICELMIPKWLIVFDRSQKRRALNMNTFAKFTIRVKSSANLNLHAIHSRKMLKDLQNELSLKKKCDYKKLLKVFMLLTELV
jgi:hypothetical protein